MSETILTQDQEKALDSLLAFLIDDDSDNKEIILNGHAGTGKTFLIQKLYDDYRKLMMMRDEFNLKPRKWTFLATTHKAAESLRSALDGFEVSTVHSSFGIDLKHFTKPRNRHGNTDILVIDECSYLNYEVLQDIRSLSSKNKIIYMGDAKQLAPVGLDHAPIFYDGVPQVNLNQVIRQQNAPNIAKYCEQLRNAIGKCSGTPQISFSDEIVWLSKDDFETKMIDNFKAGINVKALACKNSTVNHYNQVIHKALTGRKHLAKGDTLVVNETTSLIKNNYKGTIFEIYPDTVLNIKGHWIDLTTTSGSFLLFKPSSVRWKAKAYHQAKSQADYNNIARFTDLRLPYASTIHKAQGSTYHTVFINLSELNQIKTRDEINRLLYVAFSRATHQVFVTGEIP